MFSTNQGGIFPAGLFFSCGTEDFHDYLFLTLAFIAQIWISSHIWTTKSWRLDQNVFFDPLYESVLLEQSMMFTRKKKEKPDAKPKVKKIFGCATMWHETKEEMKTLLQSDLRMDKYSRDTDLAWLHIFFDDAFLEGGKRVNNYVLTLFEAMQEVQNDKKKCLMMTQEEGTTIDNSNATAALNLTDYDYDYENIGAACRRIHPTGSGIIAWYQKFEYAVGHWFQKSTEDALGNVLCSPGCFSLFRLKAFCQNNIFPDQDQDQDQDQEQAQNQDQDKYPHGR